jgi:hypothetical protein
MLALLSHPSMAYKTCSLSLTFFVASALYYLLLLDQSELAADPRIGFCIQALLQLPAYALVGLMLKTRACGRKWTLCLMLFTAGVMLGNEHGLDVLPSMSFHLALHLWVKSHWK